MFHTPAAASTVRSLLPLSVTGVPTSARQQGIQTTDKAAGEVDKEVGT